MLREKIRFFVPSDRIFFPAVRRRSGKMSINTVAIALSKSRIAIYRGSERLPTLAYCKNMLTKQALKKWTWVKKVSTGCLLLAGTTVAVFPRVVSNVAFPKDGAIVYVPYADTKSSRFYKVGCRGEACANKSLQLTDSLSAQMLRPYKRGILPSDTPANPTRSEDIFFIPGVVRDASNERLAKALAEEAKHPIILVYNGSSCKDNHSYYRKSGDYLKAALNRLNNVWTGRGNEPIIQAMKAALTTSLTSGKRITILSFSEGSLIAAEAIKDLHASRQFNLSQITFVAMGSPMHYREMAKMKTLVGEFKEFSHPTDIITCFQQDIFRFPNLADWNNWVFVNPAVKQCLATGSLRYHRGDYYWKQFFSEREGK